MYSVIKRCLAVGLMMGLGACALTEYRPARTLQQIDTQNGYRLEKSIKHTVNQDNTLVLMMFSGGGTRAAAFGYGVLESLQQYPVYLNGRRTHLPEQADIVYGVSGGSVLAAYFALHGQQTVPDFEKRFLKQNFQRQVAKQFFSFANMPRLTSPNFGRGDLLEEEFENTLFGKATFGDLAAHRRGPFAVISATDMTLGKRVDFTQDFFDAMCVDLSDVRIARAVAASSAVPLVFAPITFNNHGGNCGYTLPAPFQAAASDSGSLHQHTRQEFAEQIRQYENSRERPYIHLIDGGLTDNLAMRNLLDYSEVYTDMLLRQQLADKNIKRIVVVNVNAQNRPQQKIDRSAAVPPFRSVVDAVINIPIDQHSQESLRRFRSLSDRWNSRFPDMAVYFISLNLTDLPDSELKQQVLDIPTSFYLPTADIDRLKAAAPILLRQSGEFKRLLRDLSPPAAVK